MKNHYKTIFISDTHLGSRMANAELLLEFLRYNHCEKLVIIGDFIDFWALRRSVYFPSSHKEVLRLIIKWSARGVDIEYIPGNHDDVIRTFLPIVMDNIKILKESIHETQDGKRFLIVHGDEYDQIIKYAKWLAFCGDIGYNLLISLNHSVNIFRRIFGCGYWSLSAWVKNTVKQAVKIISEYEETIVNDIKSKGFDGVICGHIHHVEISEKNDVTYINCGDFVESCTAIVEEFNGNLKIINWQTERINRIIK
jgi:UDP-2,3-diacylglucosamine pyrophosphatase LpxH